MVVKRSPPRIFAVNAILRGRGRAGKVGVVIHCTVGAAGEGSVGALPGQVFFNRVAIEAVDQDSAGFAGNLGRGDPAGKCFKPLLENNLHGVGIGQQDLEHPRSVRDLDHLVDFYAGVEQLNLS